MVVETQPIRVQYRDWNDGLCACTNDSKICWCTLCCYWCRLCYISQKFGDPFCLPFIMPCVGLAFGLLHRGRQRINGTVCKDFCESMWCTTCYVCRLQRDMKYTEMKNGSLG
ncbi:Cornifelin [Clonorchis sinensis]|uniref:Cornifelin n=2 Tax=Clonorchis sinensis TaxID=79923 RepID=A0A8T1M3V0_CLOSI|nr:Cornifelin [Clonorchis sinensis]GAA49971.1 cornifelin [Clonorchis sinensis]